MRETEGKKKGRNNEKEKGGNRKDLRINNRGEIGREIEVTLKW